LGARKPVNLNRMAKIGCGHLSLRENISINNNYIIVNSNNNYYTSCTLN
jgi:hypothetical protein